MNILYYHGVFPKLSESFVLNEIYELDQRGHNVAVCALNRATTAVTHDEFQELDIPTRYIKRPTYSDVIELISPECINFRVLSEITYPAPIRIHAANLFRAKRCIEFVNQLDWEIDHVHTHFASDSRFGAQYVASYFEVPFTVTTHAKDLYREPIGRYKSSLLQSADRIITISEYNREYIRENFTDETPIDIVRAGIRPEKFSPSETTIENRVLSVGRFIEKKGFQYGLEAIAQATEYYPDIEYHIIGSGELDEKLKQLSADLGIENNIHFLDNVSDDRLLRELDEARVFLLPCVVAKSGDRDGIPVALMEAMAMKTPPISTRVSGIPELIDHESNGLLVDPRSPDQTSDAVVRLLNNNEEWSTYSEQARETTVQDFNIVRECEVLEDTFKKVRN